MFGLGIGELILIFAVAFLVLGPAKIPAFTKSAAEAIGGFKVHFLKAQQEAKQIEHQMRKEQLEMDKQIHTEIQSIKKEIQQ